MSATTPPDWDMTPWFDGFGSDAYARFRRDLEAELGDLEARAGGLAVPSAGASLQSWRTFLLGLEAWSVRHAHWNAYLGCLGAADARDEGVQRDRGDAARLRARVSKLFSQMRARLGDAADDAFDALVSDPELAAAAWYLRRLREEAKRRMAPDLEALSADLEVTGLSAWGRLYDRVSGQLEFTLEVPGEAPRTLPASMARSLLGDARAEVRRAALRGSQGAWSGLGEMCAACLNAIAGTRLELDRRRGIADFLEPALFDAAISRATLDALLGAVGERRAVAQRYLTRKARALGRERLGFQDLEAPLPGESEARIPFEHACERVQQAFDGFHAPLGALARRAFAARWIDHAPRPGKQPGGFCSSSAWVEESRIFMTFAGSPGDVSTLAHELGHAFHSATLREVRPWARRYPMTLAETASTFAEQVLADALLADPATGAAQRGWIRDRRLRDAAAFLLNLPMRFTFERRLYEERAAGELPVSRLCALMEEEQRAWYGESLAEDELDPWFWASKLHFYLTGIRFYNFPYTFGYLLSLGLFARARREGAGFLTRYEELLRRAGTGPAHEVVRETLGEDLETPDFWHVSIDLVEEELGRYGEEEPTGGAP